MTRSGNCRIGFLLLLPLLLFRVLFDTDDTDVIDVNEERRLVEFAATGGTLTGALCCSFIRLFLLAPDIIAVLYCIIYQLFHFPQSHSPIS